LGHQNAVIAPHDVVALGPGPAAAGWRAVVLLYVGPDQMLPLTSALGALVGILLIFWQRVVALGRRSWHYVLRKLARVQAKS